MDTTSSPASKREKTKSSSTSAWARLGGIDLKNATQYITGTALLFIALTASLLIFQSCRSTNSDVNVSDVEADVEDLALKEADPLRHPQKADAWSTRVLINILPPVSQSQIAECIEQIAAIADDAGNQDDMRGAITQTRFLVAKNLNFYHQCYYYIAARLDDRLAQGGALLSTLADEFFKTMKAMWIMARALDSATNSRDYFEYLRDRYVQISRDIFGRTVAPIGSPFDEKTRPGGNTRQPQEKAAAPATVP